MTAPGKKLVLQYDLGASTFPPGTKPEDFWIQTYPDHDSLGIKSTSDKWNRTKVTYAAVITDIDNIVQAFNKGADEIVLHDKSIVPIPDTLILDGLVRLDTIIVDGFCAINNIMDPGDALDSRGKVGGGTQKFWGRRLSVFNKLFSLAISLPCHVAAITWEDVKTTMNERGQLEVLGREPDVGGKLNVWSPGLFDGCFYHCNIGGKFMVRTAPTSEIARVGLRNTYGMDALIDVTIDAKTVGNKDYKQPFDRVFQQAAAKIVQETAMQKLSK